MCPDISQMMVFHSVDILAQLLQSKPGLRFAVGMVKDIHLVGVFHTRSTKRTLLCQDDSKRAWENSSDIVQM